MADPSELIRNNRAWAARMAKEDDGYFRRLSDLQAPKYLWIGCADSRVPANVVIGLHPGEVFVHRNVANVVPHTDLNVLSVLEYAVKVLKVEHIIVCGHSDCGAMKAVLNPAQLERMPTVKGWLRHAEVAKIVVEQNCGCADHNTLGILTEENVVAQLDHLRTHPSVAARLASGQLFIHGWVYNIGTSEIRAYDAEKGEFRLVGDGPLPMATPRARYQVS